MGFIGINEFYVKVTERSVIDLQMILRLFVEIQPSKPGQWGLLVRWSQRNQRVLCQGNWKVINCISPMLALSRDSRNQLYNFWFVIPWTGSCPFSYCGKTVIRKPVHRVCSFAQEILRSKLTSLCRLSASNTQNVIISTNNSMFSAAFEFAFWKSC